MTRAPLSLLNRNFILLTFAAFVGVAISGCKDRVFDFGGTIGPPDSGKPGDASTDLSLDRGSGGDARVDGSGGGGGDAARDGVGDGTSSEVFMSCRNDDPKRLTDIANCGTCLNLCRQPNAVPACVNGACQYACETGFFDADMQPGNGCECVKTNNGTEVCDGIDNNCDGVKDEGFNFMTDLSNCGGCNKPCYFPFAMASCNTGVCTMGACLPDFYDRDPVAPGCETSCQKTNGGVEICDGLDNNCNGMIDDSPAAATITCKSMGVCGGTTPSCMGAVGFVCRYATTYQEVEDTAKGCDGLDNDCDGRVDEAFEIGKTCTVGSGPCAGTGMWVCDNAAAGGHRCQGSMKPPGAEICDGKDNDCDGKIDELDSQADKTTDDTLVYYSARNVTMFAYEASRYDATAADHGFDSTRRPCSTVGKQPWSNVTKEEAQAACVKIGTGWRLCTRDEWFDACNGSGNTTFPYGAAYDGTKCNGYDYSKPPGASTLAAGSATACVSNLSAAAGDELFDMSGNVKEWVLTGTAYDLRGGAYSTASFPDNTVTPAQVRAPGLQCDATTPAPSVAVRLPSVGFRCCRTGALP